MPQSEFWPFNRSKTVEDGSSGGESSILQKQVGLMESEVKEIQMELAAIRRDRMFLSGRNQEGAEEMCVKTDVSDYKNAIKSEEALPYSVPRVPKICQLRQELIRAKNVADEERFQREKYERKLKDLELKINSICNTEIVEVKESHRYPNEEVAALKAHLRDSREEVEELKILVNEKTDEAQEYRVKYLQAQQQVEELKRQIDVIELDNKQVSDQIQIEIQKMKVYVHLRQERAVHTSKDALRTLELRNKMQFQEKLQELAPLPDLLKGSQIQLQEAKQLQKLAEDSSDQLSNELNRVKEKLVIAVNNLNAEKAERARAVEENNTIKAEADLKQKEIEELYHKEDDFKCQVFRLEEKLSQLDQRYKEKAIECTQLIKDLDELKMENNRSLTRSKERADSMRRYMQTQISELERQLIQTRAQCRTFQKERDDVRQRMQIQINNLQENFELVEIRLRALQNQVTALKNSYALILSGDEENSDYTKIA